MYRWSILEKRVTSTPNTLDLDVWLYWLPIYHDQPPAVNVDMDN